MSEPLRILSTLLAGASAAATLVDILHKVDLKKLSFAIKSLPVERGNRDWRDRIEKTRRFYKSGNLVLVLGAGVSVEHGLPDWRTLLQYMLIDVLKDVNENENAKSLGEENIIQIAKIHSAIFSPNPLISARFVRTAFNDYVVFLEHVRSLLYANHEIKYESKAFREIAQLCAAPGKAPSLDAVINFNFDDILERYLKRCDIAIPFTPVYAPGFVDNSKLAIYHPHGYLPHEGSLDSQNQTVFTEQDYHKQYRSIYDWSNLVQINKYAEKNCLFIGVSLLDPNLRRLMDIGRELRGTDSICHFIVRKKYNRSEIKAWLSQTTASGTSGSSQSAEGISSGQLNQLAGEIADLQETMEERDAASFGVETLWVDEWDSIPNILRDLHAHL